MKDDAQNLTLENLESLLMEIMGLQDKKISLRPTWVWAPPGQEKAALRLLGWLKRPVRKVSGIRARKRALYWRPTK